mmetsp:Transcript_23462/g.42578  ORF Transcript_23462/g.42578 Transcript_23462/m.42578 type:complete len:200 (+) Transcript_23462:94-693(+)
MPITEPLTRGHQLFLQRLLAAHVMTDDDAKKLHEELNDTRCKTLEQSLEVMNKQLSAGFGLEVATVNLNGTRHHAIINPHSDDGIAKASFSTIYTPHERAFIRLMLEKIVEEDACTRMDLINLRLNLKDPYKQIPIDAAEYCIDSLISECWLTPKSQDRRKSMNAEYELGPRTYLELSSLLTDSFGMPKDELPQMIFHR